MRQALAKRFEKIHEHGKPEVTFPCDGLGKNIREIVFETGSGHGFSLDLWRLRLAEDHASWDVRAIAYGLDPRVITHKPGVPQRLLAGRLDRWKVDALLAKVRVALSAEVHEVLPPQKPGDTTEIDSATASFSSNDFHVMVRLVDTDGRVLEREFTGYEGNDVQDRYLPVQLAIEALDPVTKALDFEERDPNDDDLDFFAERFDASSVRFDEEFHWWVTERYVELAKTLGSPAIASALLGRLQFTNADRSKVDARADAVEALAHITGWDARKDDVGRPVDVAEAAAAYVDECKPAPRAD